MPVNCIYYYDNFFQKVTNMESPRKNNDCYFYYYSTCTKGDNCTFRHEPSALGCETVCSFWKEGKCLNVHCNFRHMELRKNRKAIPCYWETQPGGCLKPHCPFLHKNNKNGECETLGVSGMDSSVLNTAIAGQSSSQGIDIDRNPSLPNQYSEAKYGNATVDPLVVKFEEESDNESAPTNSPAKGNQTRVVKVKTLEEIRLEKIQAECAAYYFYPGVEEMMPQASTNLDDAEDLRRRIMNRLNIKSPLFLGAPSLDQIRKRKLSDVTDSHKKQRVLVNKSSTDLGNIKIKTLDEIREERLQRLKQEESVKVMEDACPEVSSTSVEDVVEEAKPPRHLKRKASSTISEATLNKRKLRCIKTKENVIEATPQPVIVTNTESHDIVNVAEMKSSYIDEQLTTQSTTSDISVIESQNISSKLDDILLLDDDDLEDTNITLKAEDDILKDIDDLLNE